MCRLLDILSAGLSRSLFAVHGVLTVWCVVAVKAEPLYWLLLGGVALLVVEMAVSVRCTQNTGWKWFSPVVFLYLGTVVPSIWVLELSLLQTEPVQNASSTGLDLPLLSHIPIATGVRGLDAAAWASALEQAMLLVLVVGRWLMPKGGLSREQLSGLLLAYAGLGADILDIFDTFREEEVRKRPALVAVGLSLFSWALLQFPLVLTNTAIPQTTGPPDTAGGQSRSAEEVERGEPEGGAGRSCCHGEAWGLLLTVGMQDGPFVVFRLYLLFHERVLNQLMVFFTCKNLLAVLLEVYRICVVQFEPPHTDSHTAGGRGGGCSWPTTAIGGEEDEEEEEGEVEEGEGGVEAEEERGGGERGECEERRCKGGEGGGEERGKGEETGGATSAAVPDPDIRT